MGTLPPRFISIVCICLLLTACATSPDNITPAVTNGTAASGQNASPTESPRNYPVRPFSTQTFYDLLAAEFAGARGRVDLALDSYLIHARATRDPGVVARACKIAAYLDNRPALIEMCPLWVKLEPADIEARQLAAFAFSISGQLDAAFDQGEYLLGVGVGETLLALPSYTENAPPAQRASLLARYQKLRKSNPDNRELQFGTAQLLQQQGALQESAQILRELLAAEPENESVRLLLVQLLYRNNDRDGAVATLTAGLEHTPDSKVLRLLQIRLLAETNLQQARANMVELADKHPDDADLRFSLALFNREMGLRSEALATFTDLVRNNRRTDDAHFQLGLMAEEDNRLDVAAVHYRAVRKGKNFLSAIARLVAILARQNRLGDARIQLHKARMEHPGNSIALYQMEADLLVAEQEFKEAYKVLSDGLEEHANDISLLYSRSLASEKLRNIAGLESDLRAILQRDANNSAALNALGYSLANHTRRYAEARALIERALAISPNDPAIVDSLGWVLFREGRHEEAITQLRQAMALLPDPEIAAHLGEVLWVSGQRDEARAVWREARTSAPDNPALLETLERLQVGTP
ncbi:MAG: tetratricopeptide repeat protein [Porticoccaceae bacterium]